MLHGQRSPHPAILDDEVLHENSLVAAWTWFSPIGKKRYMRTKNATTSFCDFIGQPIQDIFLNCWSLHLATLIYIYIYMRVCTLNCGLPPVGAHKKYVRIHIENLWPNRQLLQYNTVDFAHGGQKKKSNCKKYNLVLRRQRLYPVGPPPPSNITRKRWTSAWN